MKCSGEPQANPFAFTAIASVVTDSSGAEPGSGAIRVWKVNRGANVKIKAVGAGKYISVTGDV